MAELPPQKSSTDRSDVRKDYVSGAQGVPDSKNIGEGATQIAQGDVASDIIYLHIHLRLYYILVNIRFP